LSQLLKIVPYIEGYDTSVVTTSEAVREGLKRLGAVHVVGECNREHLLQVVQVFARCWKAMRRERPDVVVSTGAAAGCLCCLLGKLFGARVVWVDSITNVERLSLSGRMVRPVADLCIVQWPELTRKYPGTQYVGNII
jgi:UDP-N-acetylglucosamine:LPS N-acetylglucosamine transferase